MPAPTLVGDKGLFWLNFEDSVRFLFYGIRLILNSLKRGVYLCHVFLVLFLNIHEFAFL